jgi:hypothetical protein
MLRVVWYQHRGALLGLGTALAVLAGVLVAAGLRGRAEYVSMLSAGCVAPGQGVVELSPCVFRAWQQFPWLSYNVNSPGSGATFPASVSLTIIVLFALAGIFLGAPLISREYERGTFRFAWTQGTSRVRWCALSVGILGGLVTLAGAGIGGLAAWALEPFNQLGTSSHWLRGQFESGPAIAAGWALLAFMAGVLAGAILKRVVPAIAVTAIALIVLLGSYYAKLYQLLLGIRPLAIRDNAATWWSGPGITTPNTEAVGTVPLWVTTGPNRPGPAGALQVSGYYLDPAGHQPIGASAVRLITGWNQAGSYGDKAAWLASHHYSYWINYQPAGRYWWFQLGAGGVLVVVALLLGAGALWLVGRRGARVGGGGSGRGFRSRGARTRGRQPEPV